SDDMKIKGPAKDQARPLWPQKAKYHETTRTHVPITAPVSDDISLLSISLKNHIHQSPPHHQAASSSSHRVPEHSQSLRGR
ncbi:unnamed protein product, partial [Ilex paraguariensis]